MAPKTTKGRQKTEIKKIADPNSLEVAFSKRHSGIFKKASELCTLCGVEISIIVFSPTEKVFSFGHPDVQTNVDRFLDKNHPQNLNTRDQLVQQIRNRKIQELNDQLTDLLDQLETEQQTNQKLKKEKKTRQDKFWWNAPTENHELEGLVKLKEEMLELKETCEKQVTEIVSFSSYSGFGGVDSSICWRLRPRLIVSVW